jgi:hypothetical protein
VIISPPPPIIATALHLCLHTTCRNFNTQLRFPFLKLQLLRDNPCSIDDAANWQSLLHAHAPLFPADLIASMQRLLNTSTPALQALDVSDACQAARVLQLPVPCLDPPPAPPPLPAAAVIGLEDGSVIAAEAAVAARVFVSHVHDIAAQCGWLPGSTGVLPANVLVEVFAGDPTQPPLMIVSQVIIEHVTFYSIKLPLPPGRCHHHTPFPR